jgi:hypothetical protein
MNVSAMMKKPPVIKIAPVLKRSIFTLKSKLMKMPPERGAIGY